MQRHEELREERGKRYGSVKSNHENVGKIWDGLLAGYFQGTIKPLPAYLVCLMMTALKLYRASVPTSKPDRDDFDDARNYLDFAAELSPFLPGATESEPELPKPPNWKPLVQEVINDFLHRPLAVPSLADLAAAGIGGAVPAEAPFNGPGGPALTSPGPVLPDPPGGRLVSVAVARERLQKALAQPTHYSPLTKLTELEIAGKSLLTSLTIEPPADRRAAALACEIADLLPIESTNPTYEAIRERCRLYAL